MDFKDTKDMDIGLKYQAIESGHVDAMPIFTTDGQVSHASIVVLEDDKHLTTPEGRHFPLFSSGDFYRLNIFSAALHLSLEFG
ncbi:MAG: glycine betaine ABC transporter substrate-binding protein, partial [Bacteroides sp.]